MIEKVNNSFPKIKKKLRRIKIILILWKAGTKPIVDSMLIILKTCFDNPNINITQLRGKESGTLRASYKTLNILADIGHYSEFLLNVSCFKAHLEPCIRLGVYLSGPSQTNGHYVCQDISEMLVGKCGHDFYCLPHKLRLLKVRLLFTTAPGMKAQPFSIYFLHHKGVQLYFQEQEPVPRIIQRESVPRAGQAWIYQWPITE